MKTKLYEPKACPVCGKQFVPTTGTQTYCSAICRERSKINRNWTGEPRVCPICGKKFKPINSGHIYCSSACREKHLAESRKKQQVKTCPACGKEFMPRNSRQIYCSSDCSHKDAYRRKNEAMKEKLGPRTCAICGKEFYPTHETQSCCSIECGHKAIGLAHRKGAAKYRPIAAKKCRSPKKPCDGLEKTMTDVNAYNAAHGTRLSYGQYQGMMLLAKG